MSTEVAARGVSHHTQKIILTITFLFNGFIVPGA